MKIQVLSDLHIEFEDFAFDHSAADVVVLAGDIHVGDKGVRWALDCITDKPVIYVLGNHEYYKQTYPKLLRKLKELVAGTNVHVLENESLEIGGITFHGCTLWTDFELYGNARTTGYECQQGMTDYKKIRIEPNYSKIRSIDIAVINHKSVKWLEQAIKGSGHTKNVVITHHAPSARSIPERYQGDTLSAAYASNLDELVEQLNPMLWIHGHIHDSCDYIIGDTKVVCNPRGYAGETNALFDPGYVVDI